MGTMNRNKRVLIIDDDEIVRLLIAKVVRKYDAEVFTACDGKEAQALICGNEGFDVIFLDLFVPYVTGWDLLNEIRAKPLTKETAVVICTGAAVSPGERETLGGKVSAFVNKEQFNLRDFDKLVSGLLSDK